jgi:hypothetical protein
MFHVIEEIISESQQNLIESRFLGPNFPLYLNDRSVHLDNKTAFSDKNTKDGYRLNHYFVKEGKLVSNDWALIEPIALSLVNRLGLEPKIASCKLNINFPDPRFEDGDYFPPHFDTTDRAIVAVYYVNQADGNTLFFNRDGAGSLREIASIAPKKGSLVYFDQSLLHANKPPKLAKVRCVINFNFLLDY